MQVCVRKWKERISRQQKFWLLIKRSNRLLPFSDYFISNASEFSVEILISKYPILQYSPEGQILRPHFGNKLITDCRQFLVLPRLKKEKDSNSAINDPIAWFIIYPTHLLVNLSFKRCDHHLCFPQLRGQPSDLYALRLRHLFHASTRPATMAC